MSVARKHMLTSPFIECLYDRSALKTVIPWCVTCVTFPITASSDKLLVILIFTTSLQKSKHIESLLTFF